MKNSAWHTAGFLVLFATSLLLWIIASQVLPDGVAEASIAAVLSVP